MGVGLISARGPVSRDHRRNGMGKEYSIAPLAQKNAWMLPSFHSAKEKQTDAYSSVEFYLFLGPVSRRPLMSKCDSSTAHSRVRVCLSVCVDFAFVLSILQ
jgi:hypothetical protein